MTTPLQTAVAGALATAQAAAAVTIGYRRGAADVPGGLQAVAGRSEFETTDDYGGMQIWTSRDYIVAADELRISGEITAPARGDQIREPADDGRVEVYEVMAPGGGDVYRNDRYGRFYRIHTKHIGTEAA